MSLFLSAPTAFTNKSVSDFVNYVFLTLNLSLTQTVSLSLSWSLVVARQFESGDDVHGLQLLEQQLAGVWDTQGGNVAGRLTVVTPGK